jgi:hypothetical protein
MFDQKSSAVSRRQLLTALGLGAGALFFPSLAPRGARAADPAPIKRIVFFITHHGTVRENWWMRRGETGYSEFEYPFDDANEDSFSQILRPLHRHREKLLVLEGLAQVSTLGDIATNNHDAAHAHLMCAAPMVTGDNAGGPSVDQLIAQQVALADRIPSLELCTTPGPWKGGFINQGPDQRVPVEADPANLFQRLFPAGSTPAAEPTERDLIRRAHGSVLDLAKNEYAALLPRLSGEDRQKLELHRDLIAGLQQRLTGLGALSCEVPTAPPTAQGTAKVNAFSDLVAAALACDLTRVVTIQATELETSEFGAPPGDVHQDYAHQTDTDPNAAQQMTAYNLKHAEQFAYLLDALSRYQEGSGTLLDNTVVVWLTELATGTHDLDKMPVVMAGSCAGYFRTGRYVSYPQTVANPHQYPSWGDGATRPVGPGHSHLLVSLMQAMGLDNDSIGLTSVTTRDGNGTTIDLTGPLPRLRA